MWLEEEYFSCNDSFFKRLEAGKSCMQKKPQKSHSKREQWKGILGVESEELKAGSEWILLLFALKTSHTPGSLEVEALAQMTEGSKLV